MICSYIYVYFRPSRALSHLPDPCLRRQACLLPLPTRPTPAQWSPWPRPSLSLLSQVSTSVQLARRRTSSCLPVQWRVPTTTTTTTTPGPVLGIPTGSWIIWKIRIPRFFWALNELLVTTSYKMWPFQCLNNKDNNSFRCDQYKLRTCYSVESAKMYI